MKKLFLLSLAILLVVGTSWAISIPQSENAENGPAIWYVPVYNDDTAFDVGDVLEWKINNSTGDNDNYVEQADSVDTYLVAGVCWPSAIAAGDTGTMAVKGVVTVDILSTHTEIEPGTLLCSSATNGAADACSNSTSDADAFGFAVANDDATNNTVKAYLFGR